MTAMWLREKFEAHIPSQTDAQTGPDVSEFSSSSSLHDCSSSSKEMADGNRPTKLLARGTVHVRIVNIDTVCRIGGSTKASAFHGRVDAEFPCIKKHCRYLLAWRDLCPIIGQLPSFQAQSTMSMV
ncbi:hypothetical protein V2G26_008012 [Clonostachys chloroleuca]